MSASDFGQIKDSLRGKLVVETNDLALCAGDSLDLLDQIPDATVGLIVTDPPYHITKKRNITGDTAFATDEEYLRWLERFASKWKRVLKASGSLYLFCSPKLSAQIQVMLSKEFKVLAEIAWLKNNAPGYDGWKQKTRKESLRAWYQHSERIICCEPAAEGNLFRSPLGNLLRTVRKEAGLSMHELTEAIGEYGTVNHGGAVSNWEAGRNIPSREQYAKMRSVLCSAVRSASMPDYEEIVRPFFLGNRTPYIDVWGFETVRQYRGKHPAEKPLELLEHIICTSSYPDSVVLDCFAGSGNTGVAALRLHRKTALLELNEKWLDRARRRLLGLDRNLPLQLHVSGNNGAHPI
ncbi:MAG: site-specific DNA-methyltransferase [Chloroflexota bacterium]